MKLRLLGALAAAAILAACSTPDAANTGAASGSGAANAGMGSASAPGSQEDLVANAGDRVLFATDRSTLSPDAQAVIGRQASFLSKYPQDSVQIAGNCDERGTEEYNIALGQRRANSDRDDLVAHGIDGARITTISYGKDRPTATGSDEQAWAQNRNAITSVR